MAHTMPTLLHSLEGVRVASSDANIRPEEPSIIGDPSVRLLLEATSDSYWEKTFSPSYAGIGIEILELECFGRIDDEYALCGFSYDIDGISREQFVATTARVIKDLRTLGDRSVLELAQHARQTINGQLRLECCLRLWLHVYTSYSIKRVNGLKWSKDQSIKSNMKLIFPKCQSIPTSEFPLQFTVANLLRYHGFKLQATDMINDHLTQESRGNKRILYIYTGIGWLAYLRVVRSPLPLGLVEEILDTYTLLFPPHEKESRKHLEFLGITNYRNSNKDLTHLIRKRRQLNRIRYEYFHDKLSGILDIFNGPTTHCKLYPVQPLGCLRACAL